MALRRKTPKKGEENTSLSPPPAHDFNDSYLHIVSTSDR